MTKNVIERSYLVESYKGFLSTLKEKLTGDTPDLETKTQETLVAAINEVLSYLKGLVGIEDVTFSDFAANAVRYQEVDTDDKVIFKAYRITNEFDWFDGTHYPANSVVYAITTEDITSPAERTIYKWEVLANESRVGDFANLDARIPFSGDDAVKNTVDVANHILKDMEITIEVADEATEGYLKTYEIYQGIDEETRVKVGVIDIPKDMVITGSEVITATGDEVTGKDADGFDVKNLEADKRYLVLYIANQDYPTYIKVEDFFKLYTTEEDAEKVQLTISGENEISAVIVENAVGHFELDVEVNTELDFVGYNHNYDDNTHADFGKNQLTTTAQNLREAVNELDEKQGDDELTTVKQDLSGAVNELDKEMGNLNSLETKLKAEDAGDDGVSTMVKAANLAYIRSVVTSEELRNDPTLLKEYVFTQDNTEVARVQFDLPVYVTEGELIKADGSEVISTDAYGNDTKCEAGKHYIRLTLANKTEKVYFMVEELFNTPEANAQQIQLAIDNDQVISGTIVAGSVTLTELDTILNKAYEVLNPTEALTTVAQTVTEGINEIVANIGALADLTTSQKNTVVAAINSIITERGALTDLTTSVKDTIVNAINSIISERGSLADLLTTDKDTLVKAINSIINERGSLADLTTDDKDAIVDAINEVDAHADKNEEHIGSMNDLTTNVKDTLVNAINEHDAEIGDLTTLPTADKTSVVNAINEHNTKILENAENILKRLRLVASLTYADFQTAWLNNAMAEPNSCVIITNDFEWHGVEYKAGTWAYLFEKEDGSKEWRYMNNGGGGDNLYIDLGTNPLPSDASVSGIAAIKTNAIYVTSDADGNKNCYLYLKRSDNDSSLNDWILISSANKGIEWIGSYNYIGKETVIDPDTGQQTIYENPWTGDASQFALITAWVMQTYGRQPEANDLVTLTVDRAYYGQFLFKNNQWQEYSSLTKASKAQYGVTIFATMDNYDSGATNMAIDPWLLKQLLADVASDAYTKAETDALLNDKVGYPYLQGQYYDKTTTDEKLKSLQKAYIIDEDPEEMPANRLERYYGSLVYYRNRTSGTTTTYIIDSTGVIENLGESGVSLDGYVSTADPKYLTLRDIKLVDDNGNPLTVQQQLDNKMEAAIGAVTTVLQKDLIKNRAVVSNSNGKIAASSVTANELNMLSGIDTTDPDNGTVEMRLRRLEEGGGGGTTEGGGIVFVTELPDDDPSLYKIYRLTVNKNGYKKGYYVWNNTAWLRLDNIGAIEEVSVLPTVGNPTSLYKDLNDLTLHMYTEGEGWTQIGGADGAAAINAYINGVQLSGNKTSEQLKIVRALTKDEYDALSVAEQNSGVIYLITDDNSEGGAVSPDGEVISVIDALNSRSSTDALSANQGRVLDGRLKTLEDTAVTEVEDSLTSRDADVALSANQGRVLKALIDAIDTTGSAIVITNDLTTNTTGTALDAKQGYLLNDKVTKQADKIATLLTRIDELENRVTTLEGIINDMFDYDSENRILTIKKV